MTILAASTKFISLQAGQVHSNKTNNLTIQNSRATKTKFVSFSILCHQLYFPSSSAMSGFDETLLHAFSSACEKLRSGGAGASSLHTEVFDLLRRPGVWALCTQVLGEGIAGISGGRDITSMKLLDGVSADDRIYFIFLAAKVLHTLIAKRWAHCQHEQRAVVRDVRDL
jgi:hypothetical protein